MSTKHFIAFDLGATSGRTILGSLDSNGSLTTKEITRFPNGMMELNGHLYWNIYSLYEHIKEGLRQVAKTGLVPTSIGVDTWGVDFASIGPDGFILGLPHAYREPQYVGARQRFFDNVMPASDLYARTGIQHIDFNTVFQFNEWRNSFGMQHADKVVFMPDVISYLLTGNIVTEYTVASSGGILDAAKRTFDREILAAVGLDETKFGPIVQPGTNVGVLSADLAEWAGLPQIPVVAVGGHDTASAVAGVPALDRNFAYLSSGTWSLMGIETYEPKINAITEASNITNEGGVEGTIRLLKNITGMWIVEQCLQRWKKDDIVYTYPEMVALAEAADEFVCFIDPDDPMFVCPADMPKAIVEYCQQTGQQAPRTHGEFIRSIFESLALKYRMFLDVFRTLAEYPIDKLHVIGGGSRNKLLNSFTANAIGVQVVAGPAEASSLGNIMMQAKACGAVATLTDMRKIIAANTELDTFTPADQDKWDAAYTRYLTIIKK
jgi:rhamnulokinase